MPTGSKDPTDPIRLRASRYPEVDEGTSCTQSAFKTGKRAFLYVGMQGGRYKAMFKLDRSLAEATKLAASEPDRYQVGNTSWVTARFTADDPLPKRRWENWLDESYALSAGNAGRKPASKTKVTAKSTRKKTSKKSVSKKTTSKKTTRKKKTTRRKK